MNRQLQILGQTVFFYGVSDHSQIIRELFLKLTHVTDVVNAFVEATGELWCDRLQGDIFFGQRRQNHQQLRRCLRAVSFVHRNLSHKIVRAIFLSDVAINFASRLNRLQEFVRSGGNQFFGDHKFSIDTVDL